MRAVAELGATEGALMKADRIAEAQDIPRHFLDNILNDLRRAGIVATQRGAEGGSRLARPAKDITLADVMRAMEGPLAAVRDVRPEKLSYEGTGRGAARGLGRGARVAPQRAGARHRRRSGSGKLPRPVAKLLDDPEAWKPH